MGIIRFLLALAVVSAHCNSHPLLGLVGVETAVQTFFVVSGFYMAMIISSYKTKRDFWISRYLRLYPTYIICASLVLFLLPGFNHYFESIRSLPWDAIAFLIFTNITIFFQDVTMFLGVNQEGLFFIKNFSDSHPPLHMFLLVPQGWSLGLEISFYILSPFVLNKKSRTIFAFLFASEIVRFMLIAYCCSRDPWSYRFFPSELSTFLLGSLAYRLFIAYKPTYLELKQKIQFVFILLFLFVFEFVPIDYDVKKVAFVICFAWCVGSVFYCTKNSKLDSFLGALSYPIYVCHLFVIGYLLPKLNLPMPDGGLATTILAFSVVVVFSIMLYVVVEKPIDIFRHKFKIQKIAS